MEDVGAVGGGEYPFKADVMDAFLRDSLHVAKSTVTSGSVVMGRGVDDARAPERHPERHPAYAHRAKGATVNSKPPHGAKSIASNARGGGFKSHPEVVQLSEKLSKYVAGGGRAASVASTGTNAEFWKLQLKQKSKGAPSVAATEYPETAVTSRVDTVVMRETLERLEKLEAHLIEEKVRRAATELQLNELRGLVDTHNASAAAPTPKRTAASARAALPPPRVAAAPAGARGGSAVSSRARANTRVAVAEEDPFSRSWLRR